MFYIYHTQRWFIQDTKSWEWIKIFLVELIHFRYDYHLIVVTELVDCILTKSNFLNFSFVFACMFGRAINNWYQLVKTSSLTKPQRRQLQKDVQDRFQVRNEKPCLLHYCRNKLEMDWNLVKGRGERYVRNEREESEIVKDDHLKLLHLWLVWQ